MKNKKLFAIALLAISVIFTFIFLWDKPLYGNDEESIVRVIRSIEGYGAESATIEILDIRDIGEHRMVSLLFNQSPAFANFTRNDKGDYRWDYFELRKDESLSQFMTDTLDEDDAPQTVLYVANEDNEVAKVHMTVNGEVLEIDIRSNAKDVVWVELPRSEEKTYRFDYAYFDEEGNEIERYE